MGWVFSGFLFAVFCFNLNALHPEPTGLLPLKSLPEASPAIQTAAKAIVLIQPPDGTSGTGFFLKENGRLVTNAHVLGPENCTREGCYTDLFFSFEHGAKPEKKEVFVVPLFTDPHWDVSAFNVFIPTKENPIAQRFEPAHGLEFSSLPTKGLVSRELSLVGHPFGGLKRWSTTAVYEVQGDWCRSGHCTPSGYSGSPMLDSEGKIVGIVHRARDTGSSTLSLEHVLHCSLFSLSEGFRSALERIKGDVPSSNVRTFGSLPFSGKINLDEVEAEDVLNPSVESMLSRKLWSLTLSSGKKNEKILLMNILKESCQEDLESEEAAQDPDFSYDTCLQASELIDCTQNWEGDEKTRCPQGEVRAEWEKLFQDVADYLELKSRGEFLAWRIAKASAFETSKEAKRAAAHKALVGILEKRSISAFPAAEHVADAAKTREDMVINGVDYLKLLQDYGSNPSFSHYSSEIASALESLSANQVVPASELDPVYASFLTDPKIPVDEKATLEAEVLARGISETLAPKNLEKEAQKARRRLQKTSSQMRESVRKLLIGK